MSTEQQKAFCDSALRSASLLLPCSVIFDEGLTLNLQQPRVFEDGIKPSKKLVSYVKGSHQVDQELRMEMLNKFDKVL